MSTDITPSRYHGLDALRAGAMLLGILLHAGTVFNEPIVLERLAPDLAPIEADPSVLILSLWIHLWRMPLFFLLAGFFAEMVLDRRGATAFIADRAVRVLCTCLIFALVLNAISGEPWGTLIHLWFLWYLWWFCALAAFLSCLRLTGYVRVLTWLFERPVRAIWLLIPASLMSLLLRDLTIVMVIPLSFDDPAWKGFLFNLVFFALGQALWQGRSALAGLAERRVIGAWLMVGTAAVAALIWIAEAQGLDRDVRWSTLLVAAPLSGAVTLAFILGLIGLAHRVVRRGSRLLTGLVRLAYPIYVFHLFLVIGIGVELLRSQPDMPQMLNMAISSVITFILCIALYLVLVRFTPLEWLFAGWRQAWFQWPFTEKGRPRGRPDP